MSAHARMEISHAQSQNSSSATKILHIATASWVDRNRFLWLKTHTNTKGQSQTDKMRNTNKNQIRIHERTHAHERFFVSPAFFLYFEFESKYSCHEFTDSKALKTGFFRRSPEREMRRFVCRRTREMFIDCWCALCVSFVYSFCCSIFSSVLRFISSAPSSLLALSSPTCVVCVVFGLSRFGQNRHVNAFAQWLRIADRCSCVFFVNFYFDLILSSTRNFFVFFSRSFFRWTQFLIFLTTKYWNENSTCYKRTKSTLIYSCASPSNRLFCYFSFNIQIFTSFSHYFGSVRCLSVALFLSSIQHLSSSLRFVTFSIEF